MDKILKHFSNLIIYGIIVFIFIALFILTEFIFESFFPRVNDYSRYFFKSLIFVVIYEPLHKLIELNLKRIIYNYSYRRQRQLIELDTHLSANLTYKEMSDVVVQQLKQILNLEQVSLYLVIPDALSLVSNVGTGSLMTKRIQMEPGLCETVFRNNQMLFIGNGQAAFAESTALRVLQNEGHHYIIPLKKREGIGSLVALGAFKRKRDYLDDEDAAVLYRALQRVGYTLENARLNGQLRKSLMERELVLGVAKRFNSTLDLERLLDMILDAVKPIVPYDAAGVFLVNYKTQEIESAVVRGYDEVILEQLKIQIGTGLVGHVAKIGKPVIVKDVNLSEHYVMFRPQTQSEVAIPICDGDLVMGVMNLESDKLGVYHEGHLDLLTALAGEAAIAIKNAQLNEDMLKAKEFEKELEIAGRLQQSILPQTMPKINGLDLAAQSIPCRSVGGDIYDVLKLSPSRIALCIGDVAGKGVPGAIMMSMLYTGYRGVIHEYDCTCDTVGALNNLICSKAASGTYATFFYGVLDTEHLRFEYTNAGHNPPLLLKPDGRWQELTRGGIVLGFLPDHKYEEEKQTIGRGDIIVLYTDGITESFNETDEMFGEQRLRDLILAHRDASAVEIKRTIIDAVIAFTPDTERQDDITVMVIKIE